ncbi:MAG: hypothetical protein CL674_10930 [Bdellovibrionaceae bacterium]|nr:hypothetical protein [Pseudobdellovibrionaceae bacterium]
MISIGFSFEKFIKSKNFEFFYLFLIPIDINFLNEKGDVICLLANRIYKIILGILVGSVSLKKAFTQLDFN